MKSIYMFDVTNAEGRNVQWYADMKKTGKIGKGRPPSKPQVTIKISDRDLVDLATGTVRASRSEPSPAARPKGVSLLIDSVSIGAHARLGEPAKAVRCAAY